MSDKKQYEKEMIMTPGVPQRSFILPKNLLFAYLKNIPDKELEKAKEKYFNKK